MIEHVGAGYGRDHDARLQRWLPEHCGFEFVRLVRNDSFLSGNILKEVKELSKSWGTHHITYRCFENMHPNRFYIN
jgi:hypothetical protein